ncbi:MAG: formylglycine-generating enzyme family protein [Planctomycetaceae bacterium]|jgi:sulfatase modifying factor 1|nr:formylglycine-generating enzyme family protein [Planctomycetaceae bacterium]
MHGRRPAHTAAIAMLLVGCMGPGDCDTVAAAESRGIVRGAERPAGAGPTVPIEGGWMVPYDETIPGTAITFRMIPVPGGTFRMGSPAAEADRSADEGPAFEVTVEPFWMGRCEVTWGEYKTYMAACELFKGLEAAKMRPVTAENEAHAVTAPSKLYDPSKTFTNGEDPDLPAVTMTQFAARQYTKWVSKLTDRFYRLPTESEWEYACRAGTHTPWSSGADAATLDAVAWFADNADNTTHPVGRKRPNAFGLHDMHGNVAEWVIDQLVDGGYGKQAAMPQPVAAAAAIVWPTRLAGRIVRGGAFYDDADRLRSAARRGSEDEPWKESDPNLPLSPWWYTEEPSLGVGMRLLRPAVAPPVGQQARWWNADLENIAADTADRLQQGRGARGIVDPGLPDEAKRAGIEE